MGIRLRGERFDAVDEIAGAIRDRIRSGRIRLGEQLRQVELASELGVSRTRVREALYQLQTTGLVEIVPNRGAVVRIPSPWEIRQAYEVRAELEALACERAATRIGEAELANLSAIDRALLAELSRADTDREYSVSAAGDLDRAFHAVIYEAGDNEWLTRTVIAIRDSFPRDVFWRDRADCQRVLGDQRDEHDRIVTALAVGDAASARAEMRAHVRGSGEQLARSYDGSAGAIRGG